MSRTDESVSRTDGAPQPMDGEPPVSSSSTVTRGETAAGADDVDSRTRSLAASLLAVPVVMFALVGGVHLSLAAPVERFDVLFAFVPGVSVLFIVVFIMRSEVSPTRYSRILQWCLVGSVAVTLVPVVMLQGPYLSLPQPHVAIVVGLWLGACGGLLSGYHETRAVERAIESEAVRQQMARARRDKQQVERLNHLLRHDILNNMAVIQGRAEFLLDATDETTAQHAAVISRQSTATIEFIQNVRKYLQTLDSTRRFHPVSLSAVLDDEVSNLVSGFPDCEVTVDVPEDVTVLADDLLGSVFGNLLRNAVIHNSSATAEVDVSVTLDDDTAMVRVSDNGPGIPDTLRGELFGEDSTGDHGFGLFLVRMLVESYDGTVTFETSTEDGTTVAVALPRT